MISNNYKKFLFLENPLKEFSDKIKMNKYRNQKKDHSISLETQKISKFMKKN